MRTLVLNASYEPIHMVDWKDAICMIVQEKAEIVSTYTDKMIRSMSLALEMPKIIKLKKYVNVAKNLAMVRYSRRNILARDKSTCQYCGKHCTGKDATLDHVVPKSRGGKSNWTNIVLACRKCNGKKDNRTPEEAGMKLRNIPVKPKAKTDALERLLKEFGFTFDSLE
jgi:5-methylcytosine-specific restriction endonuclease McrA